MSARRLGLVLAVAFAARAALLLAIGPDTRYAWTPDSEDYAACARGLARQGAFTRSEAPPLVPETLRTPGYPLLLAATCVSEACPAVRAAQWAQVFLGAATAGLAFAVCWLLFGDPRAALAAGLGLALDPVTLLHTPLLLSETLFTFLAAASLLALVWAYREPRFHGRAALAGLLCGLAALVRPAGLYFFVFGAGALWLAWSGRRGRASACAVFVAASLAAPAAWAGRNLARTGRFTVTSIQGLNIAYMRAAGVEMKLTGEDYGAAYQALRSRIAEGHGSAFRDDDEEAAYAGPWAMRFLLKHPVAELEVMAQDAVKMLGGTGLEIFSWTVLHDPADDPMSPRPPSGGMSGTRDLLRRHPGLRVPLVLSVAFLAFVYLLAARGFIAALRGGSWREATVVVSPILYFMAVSCGALAYYRLRLPLMPALFVLAGRGWAERF